MNRREWLDALPAPKGQCWPNPNAFGRYYAGNYGDRYADSISPADFLRMQGKDEKPLDPT
jgi:hypothetical protein